MPSDFTLIFILLLVASIGVSCFFYPCNLKKEHFSDDVDEDKNADDSDYIDAMMFIAINDDKIDLTPQCKNTFSFCTTTFKECSKTKSKECKSALEYCKSKGSMCRPSAENTEEIEESLSSKDKKKLTNTFKTIDKYYKKANAKNGLS